MYYVFFLVQYTDSGKYGLLERIDTPYVTSQTGKAYFEDINVLLGFIYQLNNFGLHKMTSFSGSLIVMGATGVGKTSSVMNGLGATSQIENVISGNSTAYLVYICISFQHMLAYLEYIYYFSLCQHILYMYIICYFSLCQRCLFHDVLHNSVRQQFVSQE